MMKCPKCDGKTTHLRVAPWGDILKAPDLRLAPYICGWCGSFLLIYLPTGTLIVPTDDEFRLIMSNQLLASAVGDVQNTIRALPGRRRILR